MQHSEQREKASLALQQRGLESALFTDPANITWLTGMAIPLQVGATPFLGNPSYVWFSQGHFTCLVQDSHLGRLGHLEGASDVSVVTYVGYTLDRPIDIPANIRLALEEVLHDRPPRGDVGVEQGHLPATLLETLRRHSQGVTEIDGLLQPLRMVKTGEELHKLRDNFELVRVGHAAARRAVRVGIREIDVWTVVQQAVESSAGRRVPIGNDCVVGRRQANIGGWPEELELRPHDSLILDLSTALHGYWSDSCATYFAGGATPLQRQLHGVVSDALEYGVSLVRPGVRANELHSRLRAFIERAGHTPSPHHSGHAVGASMHEAPRLAPYDETPLEPGMVIMLEPGIYLPGETGVRLEDAVLVTEDGALRMTEHDKSIP